MLQDIYQLKDKQLINYLKDNDYVPTKICCLRLTSCTSMSYTFLQHSTDNHFFIIQDWAFHGGTSTNISNLDSVYLSLSEAEKELTIFKKQIQKDLEETLDKPLTEEQMSSMDFSSFEKNIKVLHNFIEQCLLLIELTHG